MLACARRIGAVHTVVFGGFSRDLARVAHRERGRDVCIAADGVRRGGKVIDLWGIAKDALASVFCGVLVLFVLCSLLVASRHDRRVSRAQGSPTRDAVILGAPRGRVRSLVRGERGRTPSTSSRRPQARDQRHAGRRAARFILYTSGSRFCGA